MAFLTTMTLAQLRTATKAEILRDVEANNTKRGIVAELLGQDRATAQLIITRDDQGRIVQRVEVERDLLTGDRLGGRVTSNTFHRTGEIAAIVVSERDASDKETASRTITHFTDGRQPVVTETSAEEPVVVEP